MVKKSFNLRLTGQVLILAICFNLSINAQQTKDLVKLHVELYEAFKKAKNAPCGEREEAVRIAKKLYDLSEEIHPGSAFSDFFKFQISKIEKEEEECKFFIVDKTLAELFEAYKAAKKAPCGQRGEAIRIGKKILENYSGDELNWQVIQYVKADVPKIEKQEADCNRKPINPKNKSEFFAITREFIEAEGDTPLGLDLMLDLVSVGYDLAVVDKNDTYNKETLDYAKSALQKIEAGQISKTKSWGIQLPFKTKDNAQSWMNYIIGWLNYHKFNQKKEGIAYLWKTLQFEGEHKNSFSLYLMVGSFYFDEAARIDAEYREKRKANNEETDETKRLLESARATADRGIDALKKAYKAAVENKMKKEIIDQIYQKLSDFYRFRFNIAPGEKVKDLDEELKRLIERSYKFF